MFQDGLGQLLIAGTRIPDLNNVNELLLKRTGWRGVPVEGLVEGADFLVHLKERLFPIGNFIRDQSDLNYTPAPDIFHDLYGHLPFLANQDYGDFCQQLGVIADGLRGKPKLMRMCERLFWFGVEFPLVKTNRGRRIFGGGILSSYAECHYSLSDKPEVVAFDLEDIVYRDYNIDEMQKRLYLLERPEQLYGCLDELRSILLEEADT